MNYEYVKVFYTVCKHMNFSNAAKELFSSQPAISRIISNLESELHCQLFIRKKSGVVLTKEGQNFYNKIKTSYNQLQKVEDELNETKTITDNIIHIGTTVTALYCYIFKYLDQFKQKYPNVSYRLHTGSSSSILKLLESGIIDIAFITTPYQVKGNIELTNIYNLNNILVASNEYKDEIKGEVSIKDLVNYPFILLSNDMQFREHINRFLTKYNTKITPYFEADSTGILMPLVENGYGFTFIPEQMAKESLSKGKSFEVNLIEKIPTRYISMGINRDNPSSLLVNEMIKNLAKK